MPVDSPNNRVEFSSNKASIKVTESKFPSFIIGLAIDLIQQTRPHLKDILPYFDHIPCQLILIDCQSPQPLSLQLGNQRILMQLMLNTTNQWQYLSPDEFERMIVISFHNISIIVIRDLVS